MQKGYIYVLVNNAMSDLVKVGKTTLSVNERAASLSSSTSAPMRFSVFHSYEVSDCDKAELHAHRVLEQLVGRPNKNREFFNGPADTICTILDDALRSFLVRTDIDIGDFNGALTRVLRKEFTMACMEFEQLLPEVMKPLPFSFIISDNLKKMLGIYLACCIASNRDPILKHAIYDVRIKGDVMTQAIETMRAWTSDPEEEVISFTRQFG